MCVIILNYFPSAYAHYKFTFTNLKMCVFKMSAEIIRKVFTYSNILMRILWLLTQHYYCEFGTLGEWNMWVYPKLIHYFNHNQVAKRTSKRVLTIGLSRGNYVRDGAPISLSNCVSEMKERATRLQVDLAHGERNRVCPLFERLPPETHRTHSHTRTSLRFGFVLIPVAPAH